jgi:hypothetical protein
MIPVVRVDAPLSLEQLGVWSVDSTTRQPPKLDNMITKPAQA